MMADFAFSSADTKLGRFDRSFFSAVPLPGGLGFAFRPFCETLYPITAWGRERSFLAYRAHVTARSATIRIVAEHDACKMRVL
jgi:hypothetical protein